VAVGAAADGAATVLTAVAVGAAKDSSFCVDSGDGVDDGLDSPDDPELPVGVVVATSVAIVVSEAVASGLVDDPGTGCEANDCGTGAT
jgi:hypothetical protein